MITFIAGAVAGLVSTIIGFPLDSLKTIKQNNKLHHFISKYRNDKACGLSKLYKGISPALTISTISSSICFGIGNDKYINYYISGAIAGFINGVLSNPLELLKIQKQMGRIILIKDLHRGLPLTIAREIGSNAVYFGSYNDMRDKTGIFLSGGIAGMLSWVSTYPIDVIKTRVQTNLNLSYTDAIRKRKLFSGLGFCLARAFIVNSIGFVVYENIIVLHNYS